MMNKANVKYLELPSNVETNLEACVMWARTQLDALQQGHLSIDVMSNADGSISCIITKAPAQVFWGSGMNSGAEAIAMAICEYTAIHSK